MRIKRIALLLVITIIAVVVVLKWSDNKPSLTTVTTTTVSAAPIDAPLNPEACMTASSSSLVLNTALVNGALDGTYGAMLTGDGFAAPGCCVWGVSATDQAYTSDNKPLLTSGQRSAFVYDDLMIGGYDEYGTYVITYYVIAVPQGSALERILKRPDGTPFGSLLDRQQHKELRILAEVSTQYRR